MAYYPPAIPSWIQNPSIHSKSSHRPPPRDVNTSLRPRTYPRISQPCTASQAAQSYIPLGHAMPPSRESVLASSSPHLPYQTDPPSAFATRRDKAPWNASRSSHRSLGSCTSDTTPNMESDPNSNANATTFTSDPQLLYHTGSWTELEPPNPATDEQGSQSIANHSDLTFEKTSTPEPFTWLDTPLPQFGRYDDGNSHHPTEYSPFATAYQHYPDNINSGIKPSPLFEPSRHWHKPRSETFPYPKQDAPPSNPASSTETKLLYGQRLQASESDRSTDRLSYDYKRPRKSSKFFKIGKVFSVLWTEPAGLSSNSDPTSLPGRSPVVFGEQAYSKVRTFIVVREGPSYSSAVSIRTYAKRGVAKHGIAKDEHAIVYCGKTPPSPTNAELPRHGEKGLLPYAIRVVPDTPSEKLASESRIDFGRVYNIEHNIKVKSFGMVHPDSKQLLIRIFVHVQAGPMLGNPNYPDDLFGPAALSLDAKKEKMEKENRE